MRRNTHSCNSLSVLTLDKLRGQAWHTVYQVSMASEDNLYQRDLSKVLSNNQDHRWLYKLKLILAYFISAYLHERILQNQVQMMIIFVKMKIVLVFGKKD